LSISIVLVEDHLFFRESVKAYLSIYDHFIVSGEASSSPEALRMLEKMAQETGLPDVVILDWVMPDSNGPATISQLTQRYPQVRVIVLSLYDDKNFVIDALRSGARGYILKDDTVDHLEKAIHAVIGGQHYFSPVLHTNELDLI
jgi:two-component system, NarL family, response regulator DegU